MSCALVVSAAPQRSAQHQAGVQAVAVAPECLYDEELSAGAACIAQLLHHVSGEPAGAYATPAQIDCPAALAGEAAAPAGPDGFLLSGGCEEPAFDFRYRVSRFADSERPNGALRPQRGGRTTRTTATCTGMPADPGAKLFSAAPSPPIALYALTRLSPPTAARLSVNSEERAVTRIVEPLDRPPRA